MLRHHHADVAVAVAIPDGLITPVLKQADLLAAFCNLEHDEGLCRACKTAAAEAAGI